MEAKLPMSQSGQWKVLSVEERRERRRLRREKQRENNLGRAAKMHQSRLKTKKANPGGVKELRAAVHVGCSGWRYWKWRDSFYAGVPQPDWFKHYLRTSIRSRSTRPFTPRRQLPMFKHGAVSRGIVTLFTR